MSAPQTNLDKQKKRHKGPLTGMRLAILAVLVIFAGVAFWVSSSRDVADPAPAVDAEAPTD